MYSVHVRRAAGAGGRESSGLIAMMHGVTTSTVPAGWVICDGTNGTPDLRNRFVVGRGTGYTIGSTGGLATVTLTKAQLPVHNHSMNAVASGHSHSSNNGGSHSHTSTTSSNSGGHSHNVQLVNAGDVNTTPNHTRYIASGSRTTSNVTPGGHTSANLTNVSHSHSVGSAGHSHNIGNSGSTGGGGSHENLPPYYALVFVMKTDTSPNIPAGLITWWSGTVAAIPAGWAECDGAGGRPDVRNRFPIGVSTTYASGATGGANTVTLSSTQIPSHYHYGGTSGNTSHTHTHNSANHTHSVGGTHTHSGHSHNTYSYANTNRAYGYYYRNVTNQETSESGAHSHSYSAGEGGGHGHSWISGGSHSHNTSVGSSGSGNAHENRPPYRSLVLMQSTEATTLPVGVILALAALPEGGIHADWRECNGLEGTVDLSARFPVAAGTSYALGTTGGANVVALNIAEMGNHSHNANLSNDPDHNHSMDSTPAHTHNGNLSNAGAHKHNVAQAASNGLYTDDQGTGNILYPGANRATGNDGSHSHNVTFPNVAAHVHNTGNTNHTHNTNLASEGSGYSHENRPPYRAVAFIQKVA